MRSLLGFLTLSLSAIAIAATACADAPPVEDIDAIKRDEEAKEPEPEKIVIPPPPPPAETTKDAGTPPKQEEKKDPPPPPPPPQKSEDCDSSDPTYYVKYLMSGGPLEPCPCSANECCYKALGIELGCLEK
jgi:hypothetical protein